MWASPFMSFSEACDLADQLNRLSIFRPCRDMIRQLARCCRAGSSQPSERGFRRDHSFNRSFAEKGWLGKTAPRLRFRPLQKCQFRNLRGRSLSEVPLRILSGFITSSLIPEVSLITFSSYPAFIAFAAQVFDFDSNPSSSYRVSRAF